MRLGITVLRAALATLAAVSSWTASHAKADPVQYLLVPSAAMGRDIPVAFQAGGPHAVVLLDAFDAAPQISNLVTAGGAMTSLVGTGVSVVAPAGGAWSPYTDWEQDGSRQWETFLSTELPNWLTANEGLAATGHAIVGAARGGTAALTLAAFHPDRYRYAGSPSGFLTPSNTTMNGAIAAGLSRYGGVDTRNMWGLPQLGRWERHDPHVDVQLLSDNNTRLWIYSLAALTCSAPAAMIGYCDQAQGSTRTFYADYRRVGGHDTHVEIPPGGEQDWTSWSQPLAAMAPDIAKSTTQRCCATHEDQPRRLFTS